MPLNNFVIFERYVEKRLKNDGDFFNIIVMTRKKDFEDGTHKKQSCVIYTTNVYSVNELRDIQPTLETICINDRARCYITVNKRTDEGVAKEVLKYMVDMYVSKNYHKIRTAYDHCVNTTCSIENKMYMLDVDEDFTGDVDDVILYMKDIQTNGHGKDGEIYIVPTKNGVHLLVPPFDVGMFKKKYPTISVKKNDLTLMYCF